MLRQITVLSLCLFALVATLSVSLYGGRIFAGENDAPAQVLRHVVLFQFKDTATPAQIREIEAAFCRLPSATGLIRGFEWGTNVSPEGLDQGFTHCFVLTFNNEEDRNAYLPHPAHKEFGALLGPSLEKVAVMDYWTKP